MRRGLILVERAGDYAGSRMIAGTIAAGSVGDDAGYGMRRGTLLVGSHGRLTPTFVETGHHDLVFLRLLARSLKVPEPPPRRDRIRHAAALLRRSGDDRKGRALGGGVERRFAAAGPSPTAGGSCL